jgi:hypothetical protein
MSGAEALQLTSFKENETSGTQVEIDEHIGFAFVAPSGALGNGHLFLQDDKTGSFVELSIDLSSGRLTGATLVGCPLKIASKNIPLLDKVPQKTGVPVFGNHGFDQNAVMPRIDCNTTLLLTMLDDGFVIQCGESSPDSVLVCGRARFLFMRNILVGLGAVGLTMTEMAALSHSLG